MEEGKVLGAFFLPLKNDLKGENRILPISNGLWWVNQAEDICIGNLYNYHLMILYCLTTTLCLLVTTLKAMHQSES